MWWIKKRFQSGSSLKSHIRWLLRDSSHHPKHLVTYKCLHMRTAARTWLNTDRCAHMAIQTCICAGGCIHRWQTQIATHVWHYVHRWLHKLVYTHICILIWLYTRKDIRTDSYTQRWLCTRIATHTDGYTL